VNAQSYFNPISVVLPGINTYAPVNPGPPGVPLQFPQTGAATGTAIVTPSGTGNTIFTFATAGTYRITVNAILLGITSFTGGSESRLILFSSAGPVEGGQAALEGSVSGSVSIDVLVTVIATETVSAFVRLGCNPGSFVCFGGSFEYSATEITFQQLA